MSRRIVIEEPCEHGTMEYHKLAAGAGVFNPERNMLTRYCLGGSRIVLEGIPDEWVERASAEIEVWAYETEGVRLVADAAKDILEAAVFGGSDVEG